MTPQIDWTDTPPTGTNLKAADLRRCPPGGAPTCLVLSTWITGNELHWWNGRSFPHLKTDCPACAAKRPKVWKGYLACLDPKTRAVFVMEITPNCVDAAAAYKQTFGTLRGSLLTLNRSATKANGRVSATFGQTNLNGLDLPAEPDVRPMLERMWQTDHRPNDRKPEDPRPINDSPDAIAELKRRYPERFTTDGNRQTPVYETTPEQREMLRRNGAANRTKQQRKDEAHQ